MPYFSAVSIDEIAWMRSVAVKPAVPSSAVGSVAEVRIVYQSLDGMRRAIPGHRGDWYFSGNYPTPGGNRLVCRAYINYYEGNPEKRS